MGFFSSLFKTTTTAISIITKPIVSTTISVVETVTEPIVDVTTTVIDTITEPIKTVIEPIVESTEYFVAPMINTMDSLTHTQENIDKLTSMFVTFNTTMQTAIQMNEKQLQTILHLSSDIGTMADRIGDMSDRIIITQQIQSPNFVASENNAIAFISLATSNTTTLSVNNDALNVIPDITSSMTSTTNSMFQASIDAFEGVTSMISPLSTPTLPWITSLSNETSIGTMLLSMSQTMQSMMSLSTQYANTVIQLTHDIGTMAQRIGDMSDRIIETKELQDENFIATEENFLTAVGMIAAPSDDGEMNTLPDSTAIISMDDVAPATTINPDPVDRTSGFETILSASDAIGQLADGIGSTADLMVDRNINPEAYIATALNSTDGVLNLDNTSITQMTSEFNTLISRMSLSILTAGSALDAMVAMFDSANEIIRTMITINERFVNTVLALSDDIGTMADRIGDMSDRIVETQGILSPTYQGESLPSVSTDSVALTGASLINEETTVPVEMSMLTNMTESLGNVLVQMGTHSAIDNETFFDIFESMFVTANETMQMMSDVNSTYLNAILKLSDDIGLMSERIGEMSDRILQTQVLQSENFLATEENFLEGVSLLIDTDNLEPDNTQAIILTFNDVIKEEPATDLTALLPETTDGITKTQTTVIEAVSVNTASRSEIASLTITIEPTSDIII